MPRPDAMADGASGERLHRRFVIVDLEGRSLDQGDTDAPNSDQVVEVALGPAVAGEVTALREQGSRVGVLALSSGGGARPGDEVDLGRFVGWLTAALLAGAEVVRTDAPRPVRRVVAVVAALQDAVVDDARMGP